MDSDMKKRDLILIVTDKTELKNMIYRALEDEYGIITVSSVPEALSAITLKLPDMFVADIDLPLQSGVELLRKIREGIKTKLIPFLLLSPDSSREDKITAMEIGADDYLSYPFSGEELKAVVKLRLNKFKEFYLLSITDELTRLYNRREFIKKFNDEISEYPEKVVSLAILDIDHFKKVNDMYGHQTGDIVLMKLAEILKSRASENFFPARFGGEEFVILFPGLKMEKAEGIMKELLKEFSDNGFTHRDETFNVTFSAGIAEYPMLSGNVSEMLSRADQALYSAKEDGRNRVYMFSHAMIRNDKFWQYITTQGSVFINENFMDTTTRLPYLPQVLEQIMDVDYEIKSIGVLVLAIRFIERARESMNCHNVFFDVENIKMIISNSCQLVFPSDMLMCISDFFSHQFMMLFPSLFDLSSDLTGFNNICRDVSYSIRESLKNMNIDIEYSSGVVFLDRENPKKIYEDLDIIRGAKNIITNNQSRFNNLAAIINDNPQFSFIKNLFELKHYYNIETGRKEYQYLALKSLPYNDIFQVFVKGIINTEDRLRAIGTEIGNSVVIESEIPFLLPFIPTIEIGSFFRILSETKKNKSIIILFSEHQLMELSEGIDEITGLLSGSLRIGVDNCYIGKEALSVLSMHEYSVLIFSDNILRNIHFFRDRINIVNGLKLFLDQLGIPALAKNVRFEEEFEVLKDLKFKYVSGQFTDSEFGDGETGTDLIL